MHSGSILNDTIERRVFLALMEHPNGLGKRNWELAKNARQNVSISTFVSSVRKQIEPFGATVECDQVWIDNRQKTEWWYSIRPVGGMPHRIVFARLRKLCDIDMGRRKKYAAKFRKKARK